MNKAQTTEFLTSLFKELKAEDLQSVESMIIPPFTSLDTAKAEIDKSGLSVQLGAQDLSQYASGAYTGEISTDMIKETGANAVLVGHSERREIFNEDDSIINAKLKTGIEAGLTVVLCCGESEATREAGKTDEWVCGQIASALEGQDFSKMTEQLVVAYEPIWAIGTGKTCDATEANRVITQIRAELVKILGEDTAQKIRILYGGSVKSANIEEIITQSDIDGALIGGASLKVEEYSKIISVSADKSKVAA